jgi:hypothetical protein
VEFQPVTHFSASTREINPGGFESVGAGQPYPTEYFVEYPVYLFPKVDQAFLWFQVLTPYDGEFPDAKIRTNLSTYEGDGLRSTMKYGKGELWGSFLAPMAADPLHPSVQLLDVTTVVQAMQQTEASFAGFRLHDPLLLGRPQQIGVLGPRFGEFIPVLLINEVPEPTSLFLLAGGASAFVGMHLFRFRQSNRRFR